MLPISNIFARITNNRLRLYYIHRKHRKKHGDTYRAIDTVLNKFHSAGGLTNSAQHYKLFELKRLLEKYQPRSVIEFGTGSTTPILVSYARGAGANLTCVDEDEYWLQNSREMAGVSDDDLKIRFVYAQKTVDKEVNPIEIHYDYEFREPTDFVLIDGPSLIIDGASCRHAINSDVISLFDTSPPSTVLVDVRVATVDAIKKRLGEYYNLEVSDLLNRSLNNNYNYFSVFRLKSATAN